MEISWPVWLLVGWMVTLGFCFFESIVEWWIEAESPLIFIVIALCLAIPVCTVVDGLIFGTNWLLKYLGVNPYYQEVRDVLFWIAGVVNLLIFAVLLLVISSKELAEALGKASR